MQRSEPETLRTWGLYQRGSNTHSGGGSIKYYKHIQHSSSPIIIIIWFIIVQALILMYLILQRLLVFTAPVVWFKVRFCQTESETAAHVPHAETVSVSTPHSSHALIITVTRSLSKLTSVTFTKIIISFNSFITKGSLHLEKKSVWKFTHSPDPQPP